MGDVVQGTLNGCLQSLDIVLRRHNELLFEVGIVDAAHARSPDSLLARMDHGADDLERRLAEDMGNASLWYQLGLRSGGRVGGKKYSKIDCYKECLRHNP